MRVKTKGTVNVLESLILKTLRGLSWIRITVSGESVPLLVTCATANKTDEIDNIEEPPKTIRSLDDSLKDYSLKSYAAVSSVKGLNKKVYLTLANRLLK